MEEAYHNNIIDNTFTDNTKSSDVLANTKSGVWMANHLLAIVDEIGIEQSLLSVFTTIYVGFGGKIITGILI